MKDDPERYRSAAIALRALARMADTWPDEEIRTKAAEVLSKFLIRFREIEADPATSAELRTDIRRALAGFHDS